MILKLNYLTFFSPTVKCNLVLMSLSLKKQRSAVVDVGDKVQFFYNSHEQIWNSQRHSHFA